jgi:rubrerythrin
MNSENPRHDSKDRRQTIEVVKRNWQAEVETAQTYRDLAGRESDEKRRGVLLRMAEAEERHAQRWEKKLRDLGAELPVLKDTIGRKLSRWWNKIAGAEIAIRRMEATEERQEAQFHDQAERALAGEQDVQEFLRKSALEEKAHARALGAMAVIIIPVAVSVHPVVSWVFGMTLRPGWHSTIFGPYFVVGAIFSGIAAIITAMVIFRRAYHLERYLEPRHFRYLAYLLLTLDLLYLYFTFTELLTEGYVMNEETVPVVQSLLVGQYAPFFLVFLLGAGVVPLALVAWARTRTVKGIVVASCRPRARYASASRRPPGSRWMPRPPAGAWCRWIWPRCRPWSPCPPPWTR